jgi:acetylornithine aminotransferase
MLRLRTLRSNPGLAPQDFVNAAAQAAWSDDDHVAERRAIFAEKRTLFLEFFDEIGVEVVASESTIYLWIKVPEGDTDESYTARLLRAGIVLSPGPMFGVSGAGAGYVRLALVPELEVCRQAIDVWRRAVQA